jgi:ubiquinone/menaquinone biosynthesis C-methylase UbiE
MDYVQKTIAAYDQDPQNYINNTKDLLYIPEIDKFTRTLSSKNLILDAGCAYSKNTELLIKKGFKVIGIDLSEKLLKYARKSLPQVQFLQMDIRDLKFADNAFDGIWCHAVLLHLKKDDLRKTLKEFYRVLKEKGILYVSFKEGKGEKELVESFTNKYPRFYSYQTINNVKSMLKEANFKLIEAYTVNERERFGKDKRDLNWICAFARK